MRNEWTLIFFTLLVQMAVGACLIFSVISFYTNISLNIIEIFYSLLFFLVLAALLISIIHLGNPKKFYLAILNVNNSWLSKEVIFLTIFFVSIALLKIYDIHEISKNVYKIYLIVLNLFGIATIYSMTKIYKIRTVPVWNNLSTIINFWGASLSMGIVLVILFIFIVKHQIDLRVFIGLLGFVLFFNLLGFVEKHNKTKPSLNEINLSRVTNLSMKSTSSILYLIFVFITLSLIFLIYINIFQLNLFYFVLVSFFTTLSEILSRYHFYLSYRRLGI